MYLFLGQQGQALEQGFRRRTKIRRRGAVILVLLAIVTCENRDFHLVRAFSLKIPTTIDTRKRLRNLTSIGQTQILFVRLMKIALGLEYPLALRGGVGVLVETLK